MYYSRLQVTCNPDFTEILMAEFAEAGFDTFMETETGFEAYVEMEKFDKAVLVSIQERYSLQTAVIFQQDRIEKQNWNEEWEKNYSPINVEDKCLIRAGFHEPDSRFPYEIVITPKMSFGTGHHQTTYLMIKNQMRIDHKQKIVMDAGCGTAVLSIMASKLGAASVQAFDIDSWSIENGNENIGVNDCHNITIQQGNVREVDLSGPFDIILANINKNVLMSEMKEYAALLKQGGTLLLSGFYEHDVDDLNAHAGTLGLSEVARDERDHWACLQMLKR